MQLKKTSRFHDSFKIAPSVDDENTGHLPENARATIFEQTSREGVASDFGRRILFLPELSINNLAFSAGLVIFGSLSNLKEDYSKAEDLFVAETLKFIFGHLANKILNPRISLHSRKAIEDYLGAIRGKHVVGQRRLRRDVARATLKFFNWAADAATSGQENIAKDRNVPLDILHTDTRSAHDVARHIAQTTTSAIYSKMLAGRLDTTDIAKWFSRKCDTSSKAKLLLKDLIRFA
ncbi:MAG: hypothetical protein NTV34_10755 [Proteobacteria bacterium]|nr:hypothetical protein [Pseudomonadota bacterium]